MTKPLIQMHPTNDRRYWHMFYSECEGSHARDGQINWTGLDWASENRKIVSTPRSVIDNYGFLQPTRPVEAVLND